MTDQARTGPLQDLTIIDCTMAYAGPFGTALLADLGANVIKIEPPTGDMFRTMRPHPPEYHHCFKPKGEGADYGMPFASVNRNKRSVCLDFKNEADRETFFQLCEHADAVVENMRGGVMDELGLSYEEISSRNPTIVYGALRGYGDERTGESPYSDWPSLDATGQSVSGLVEATGDIYPIGLSDLYPGAMMALGVLAAVHNARATGQGEFFDVSMYDASLNLIRPHIPEFSLTGMEVKPGNSKLVPYTLFPAKDGRVAIAAPVERHWQSLCKIMGREELTSDERSSSGARRVANQQFVEDTISAWSTTKSKAELLKLLGGKVPFAPVNTMAEIFTDPHVAARELLEDFQLPGNNPSIKLAASPIKFQHSKTGLFQRPPLKGEHTDAVLTEFGLSSNSTQE